MSKEQLCNSLLSNNVEWLKEALEDGDLDQAQAEAATIATLLDEKEREEKGEEE